MQILCEGWPGRTAANPDAEGHAGRPPCVGGLSVTALVVAALARVPAQAGTFSNLFVFGDSLSDTPNLFLATGGAFPDLNQEPYFDARYSSGPLWVETLAAGLGLPNGAKAYLTGGNKHAYAGARTGTAGDPNALYVVASGGNDMRDARSKFSTHSAADNAGRQLAANAAVTNLAHSLGSWPSTASSMCWCPTCPIWAARPRQTSSA